MSCSNQIAKSLLTLCVFVYFDRCGDSPNTTERIDSFLDVASGDEFNGSGKVLGINQVLVNEYAPGQGISVSDHLNAINKL